MTDSGAGVNKVAILLGNGDGTFKTPVTYATGTDPVAVVAQDFNNDGQPELIVPDGDGNITNIVLNQQGRIPSV